MKDTGKAFEHLVEIVAKLRDPEGGCPWDLEQTHESIKPYLIEEAYEALEALDISPQHFSEELGDVLLQVVLHAQIASEADSFNIINVLEILSEKLIQRHPHVFGDTTVEGTEEVLKNWEKDKQKKQRKSVLDGVPKSMPALLKAQRIGEKAARLGFDWANAIDVKAKIREELEEFLSAFSEDPDSKEAKEEFGDLLFSVSQLGRHLGYNTEDLLNRATAKFSKRFKHMEANSSKNLQELGEKELDKLWNTAKKACANL